jgi:lipid-binding SYLF domain-containing protein
VKLAIRLALIAGLSQAASLGFGAPQAHASAADAREIDADANAALVQLYTASPKAAKLGKKAVAILVFPAIFKGAFLVGAQSGNGVLLVDGKPSGYYNISAASFGFQAGGKKFSYALFFMNQGALSYLQKSDGWAIGAGPSVVVVDKGYARGMTSTTLTQDVYAFPFGQKGLMGGLGLEGSKITHYTP